MTTKKRVGTVTVAHAIKVAAWRGADPATRGPFPVDHTVVAVNTASPWRRQKACMDASHWSTEMRVGAAVSR